MFQCTSACLIWLCSLQSHMFVLHTAGTFRLSKAYCDLVPGPPPLMPVKNALRTCSGMKCAALHSKVCLSCWS